MNEYPPETSSHQDPKSPLDSGEKSSAYNQIVNSTSAQNYADVNDASNGHPVQAQLREGLNQRTQNNLPTIPANDMAPKDFLDNLLLCIQYILAFLIILILIRKFYLLNDLNSNNNNEL